MLGRQQIANVSTAISELFKNAYDAYANDAEVDYFRSDKLLVIRDNGVGMTPEEFEERWLVLGTESKYAPTAGKPNPTVRQAKTNAQLWVKRASGVLQSRFWAVKCSF